MQGVSWDGRGILVFSMTPFTVSFQKGTTYSCVCVSPPLLSSSEHSLNAFHLDDTFFPTHFCCISALPVPFRLNQLFPNVVQLFERIVHPAAVESAVSKWGVGWFGKFPINWFVAWKVFSEATKLWNRSWREKLNWNCFVFAQLTRWIQMVVWNIKVNDLTIGSEMSIVLSLTINVAIAMPMRWQLLSRKSS